MGEASWRPRSSVPCGSPRQWLRGAAAAGLRAHTPPPAPAGPRRHLHPPGGRARRRGGGGWRGEALTRLPESPGAGDGGFVSFRITGKSVTCAEPGNFPFCTSLRSRGEAEVLIERNARSAAEVSACCCCYYYYYYFSEVSLLFFS